MYNKNKTFAKLTNPIAVICVVLLWFTPACSRLTNRYGMHNDADSSQSASSKKEDHSLCNAVCYGHFNTVKELLNVQGIDVNQQDKDGRTPLHMAVLHNRLDMVQALRNVQGIDVNQQDKDGCTPLHMAAFQRDLNIVNALLGMTGIDVNLQDKDGRTLLHLAGSYGRLNIVNALLNMEGTGIDVNQQDKHGYTPLHLAALDNHLDVVQALRNVQGIDVNLQDKCGNTPLHLALFHRDLNIVEALLGMTGIDVNLQDKDGRTPLHMAAFYGHLNIVKALLGMTGIDVNLQDKDGRTPLHLAALRSSFDIVEALLKMEGIDVGAKDENGCTAFHMMVKNNNGSDLYQLDLDDAQQNIDSDLLKLFVDAKGIDLNAKDTDGYTFIYWTLMKYYYLIKNAPSSSEDLLSRAKHQLGMAQALLKKPNINLLKLVKFKGDYNQSGYFVIDRAQILGMQPDMKPHMEPYVELFRGCMASEGFKKLYGSDPSNAKKIDGFSVLYGLKNVYVRI